VRPDVAVLVGGPRDGEEIHHWDLTGREMMIFPVPLPAADLLDHLRYPIEPLPILTYCVARYRGWPSRDDQGRIRYVYRKT
jgi:hypothetical protein